MIKFLIFIFIIFTLQNCSFKNPGGFFEDKYEKLQREIARKNSILVFEKKKVFEEEISGKTNKKLSEAYIISNWTEKNFDKNNYIPHIKYENKLQLIYKSKKIGNKKFNVQDKVFEPIFYGNKIYFYDLSGNIYAFSINQKKLIWKFNFYKKRFKKIPINIKMIISNENIILSDNLGYIYSININSGKLVWAKNYGVPFRSNIKIDDNNIFLLNQDNKFYTIKEKTGEKTLDLETFPSFLKSKLETTISLDPKNKNLYFITSSGELYSINYATRNINWLSTIFSDNAEKGSSLFFSSPIIYKGNKIFFSSSESTFSINSKNGIVNWKFPFGTYIRPVYTNNYIFLVSENGLLLNLNNKNGKVIWSKNLFKASKKIKKNKIGFIKSLFLVSNQLLITTSNGYFIFVNYQDGNITKYTKASRVGFFSNPIFVDNKMYIIDNKMRVLVYN